MWLLVSVSISIREGRLCLWNSNKQEFLFRKLPVASSGCEQENFISTFLITSTNGDTNYIKKFLHYRIFD